MEKEGGSEKDDDELVALDLSERTIMDGTDNSNDDDDDVSAAGSNGGESVDLDRTVCHRGETNSLQRSVSVSTTSIAVGSDDNELRPEDGVNAEGESLAPSAPRHANGDPTSPKFLFTASGIKRKPVSPLSRDRSASTGDCRDQDKKWKGDFTGLERLSKEIKKLLSLVNSAPKTKTEIKCSAKKLEVLAELAWLDVQVVQTTPQDTTETMAHVETREFGTQTPSSIATESDAAEIRELFNSPDNLKELVARPWPRATFQATRVVKGGMFSSRPETARIFIALHGAIGDSDIINRLGQTIPMVKKITDSSLPAGKSATIRCGGEIIIDGKANDDDQQVIVVSAVESLQPDHISCAIRSSLDALKTTKAKKICLAFPPDLEVETARKLVEIMLNSSQITAEIVAPRNQRIEHHHKIRGSGNNRQVHHGKPETLTLSPLENCTMADIVKGFHENIDPQQMGVQVKSFRETANGSLRVTFKETGNSNTFANTVRTVLAAKAKLHQKTAAIIIDNIEAGLDQTDVVDALSKALGVDPVCLNAGKISPRRSLIISMSEDQKARALVLKRLLLRYTSATIRDKIDPEFCSKCQVYGHASRSCTNSTPCKIRCMNCGQMDGHMRAECPNPTACFACNLEGHRANSMSCPVFRKLVHDKRNRK